MGSKKAQFEEQVYQRFIEIERVLEKEPESTKDRSSFSWGLFLNTMEVCYVLDYADEIDMGMDLMNLIIAYGNYALIEEDIWEFIKELHPEYLGKRIELIKIRYPQVIED